jgi:hypothetical protein
MHGMLGDDTNLGSGFAGPRERSTQTQGALLGLEPTVIQITCLFYHPELFEGNMFFLLVWLCVLGTGKRSNFTADLSPKR